jgi:hypothetical protein
VSHEKISGYRSGYDYDDDVAAETRYIARRFL